MFDVRRSIAVGLLVFGMSAAVAPSAGAAEFVKAKPAHHATQNHKHGNKGLHKGQHKTHQNRGVHKGWVKGKHKGKPARTAPGR